MTKKHHRLIVTLIVGVVYVTSTGLVILTPRAVTAASTTVKLYTSPANVTVYAGNTFSLQIRLLKSSPSKVNYVNALISYNPSLLGIVSVSKIGSTFNVNGGPTVSYSNNTGSLTVTGQSSSYVPTPSDSLIATVTYTAKKSGSTSVDFSSGSEAGSQAGPKNVKNYLVETSGTTAVISNPPVSIGSSGVPPATGTANPSVPTPNPATPTISHTSPASNTPQKPAVAQTQQKATTQANGSRVQQQGSSIWWPWALGGVMVSIAVACAGIFYRLHSAARVLTKRRAYRNIKALGGTAIYIARYIHTADSEEGLPKTTPSSDHKNDADKSTVKRTASHSSKKTQVGDDTAKLSVPIIPKPVISIYHKRRRASLHVPSRSRTT